jgi:hypothetical protein
MRLDGHVVRTVDRKYEHSVLERRTEERDHFDDVGLDGKMIVR